MNCNDVRDALLAGGSLDGEALHAHLQECEGCAALLEDEQSLGASLARSSQGDTADGDLGDMLGALQSSIAEEKGLRSAAQELPTPVRAGIATAALLVLSAVILAASRRADFEVYPLGRWLSIAAAFGGGAIALVWLSLRGLYRRSLSTMSVWTALAIAALLPVGVAYLSVPHSHPASMLGVGDDFVPRAMGCFMYGTITAIPLMVVGWFLARHRHRMWPAALLIAGAAGLAGNLMLHIHCPLHSATHQLAGHVPVLVALVAVYGWWKSRTSTNAA